MILFVHRGKVAQAKRFISNANIVLTEKNEVETKETHGHKKKIDFFEQFSSSTLGELYDVEALRFSKIFHN